VISVFGGKKFEVNMPTYMMCVLVQFNGAQTLSYKEIAEATQIAANELKRNLLVMAFGKLPLLSKQPATKKVDETDQFEVVAQFKSKLLKVKIAGLAAGSGASGGASGAGGKGDDEASAINKEVQEERQYQYPLLSFPLPCLVVCSVVCVVCGWRGFDRFSWVILA
jgi:hypothetical protein